MEIMENVNTGNNSQSLQCLGNGQKENAKSPGEVHPDDTKLMANWEGCKKGGDRSLSKPHKGKLKEIEEDVFKCGAARHGTQFTKSLKNIADYVQINNNSKVAKVI